MKLLKKQVVFLSSAEKGSGTRGDFVISLPQNDEFDETLVFNIFISQLHIHNTFSTISDKNCYFEFAVAPPGPEPLFLASKQLPRGALLFYNIAEILTDLLFAEDNDNLRVSTRYGRLCFYRVGDAADTVLWLNFYDNDDHGYVHGLAHQAFGFPSPGKYSLIADPCPTLADGADSRYNLNDGGSNNPTASTLSPNIIIVNTISHLLVTTTLPSDNYIINESGVSNAGVTCDIPITADPLSLIVYNDKEGVNAIYERGRTLNSSLNIKLTDKDQNIVIPESDWSFVLNIEQYRDTDQLLLDGISKGSDFGAEIAQLLKMLLLQREFRSK